MLRTMGRRFGRWLEKWGYALMCVLCAAVVLLSALWTRDAQREEQLSLNALSGMDETLEEKKDEKAEEYPVRPVSGRILRPFSLETVYFEETRVFSAHPGVDFAADEETNVFSAKAGRVAFARDGEVHILNEEELWVYRGLETLFCAEGQEVEKGEKIGTGGGYVAFEGAGHVCIRLTENGVYADFAPRLP